MSRSIATALNILYDCKIPGFANKNVIETAKFLITFNDLFDIFNANCINQLGFKKPICIKNVNEYNQLFHETETYIRSLKLKNREFLLDSQRKTGFLGCVIGMQSLKGMYNKYVATGKLSYICTYKLSQDHLELFFGSIRSSLGRNNNPTLMQFKAAYKKLLLPVELIHSDKGNCIPIQNISVLHFTGSPINRINKHSEKNPKPIIKDVEPDSSFNDHTYNFNFTNSELKIQIISYICGYVVRFLRSKIKCTVCIENLISVQNTDNDFLLINRRNQGGLIYPSKDTV